MGGLDVRRLGGVGQTAGDRQAVARFEDPVEDDVVELRGRRLADRRAALDGTLRTGQGGPYPPPLAPGELHDDDVVEVEVDVESTLGGWGQVGVDLDRVVELEGQVRR